MKAFIARVAYEYGVLLAALALSAIVFGSGYATGSRVASEPVREAQRACFEAQAEYFAIAAQRERKLLATPPATFPGPEVFTPVDPEELPIPDAPEVEMGEPTPADDDGGKLIPRVFTPEDSI